MKSRNPRVGPYGMWALTTLVVVNSLLLVPQWIVSGGLRPHWVALEAIIVVGAFLALPPRRWVQLVAWTVSALLVAVSVLLLADATARTSLARPLNLYLDLQLLDAVSNLLSGSLGPALGLLVLVVGVVAAGGTFVILAVLLETLSGVGEGLRDGRTLRIGAALVIVGLVLIPLRWVHPQGVRLGLTSVQLVREQVQQAVRMMGERARFAAEFETTPSLYAGMPGLLAELGGRDVVMAFVESYGMTVLDDERYSQVMRPRLAAMEERVAAAGVHMATGSMVAPSQGGQSWLGHGSVLSGLWLENQLRYDLLLASERGTLVDDFEAAGYSTVAIMPAITMAWPEGERFGYDRIYAFADIDYRGPPLNWVTMPDQFTWSFLQRAVLDEDARGEARAGYADRQDGPIFAEVGLISSHAPWTPILPVVEAWDSVGDGTIFERWADAGETPEELWRDTDRVRESYALAVGYAVDVLASYAANFVDDEVLLIALGDHQPAPLVTGDDAPRTVPVHVFATDPALIAPFLAWGFEEGAFPPAMDEPRRMDAFRRWFVEAFSTGPTASGP